MDQTPRSMVKNIGTHRKVLSQGILMWNIKALALTVQMLLAKLKFSKKGSNSKVKVTVSKILVPTEINTHVKYQSYSTHCSKVISKVKVSERRTEWQNDSDRVTKWQTGQKQYAPRSSISGAWKSLHEQSCNETSTLVKSKEIKEHHLIFII